jgi:hypothetical protein
MPRRHVSLITALLVASTVGAAGVGAGVLRGQATIDGTPATTRVITENTGRVTTSVTFTTLRSTTITVPAGENHLVVVRLTGSAVCYDPNPLSNAALPPRCAVRVKVGNSFASPSFLEFTGRSTLHAVAARGPLPAGIYPVVVQWSIYTGGGRFSMPNGTIVEIEQIRT